MSRITPDTIARSNSVCQSLLEQNGVTSPHAVLAWVKKWGMDYTQEGLVQYDALVSKRQAEIKRQPPEPYHELRLTLTE